MIPQPKHQIGDKVYYANGYYGKTSIKCPDCLGTVKWEVTTPRGEQFDIPCSTCSVGLFSSGYVNQYGPKYSAELMTIGSIRIDSADKEHQIRYMCHETGIGTGTLYDEANLFTNEAEALEVAKIKADTATAHIIKCSEDDAVRQKKKSHGKPSRERIALWKLGKELTKVREELAKLKGEK